MNKMLLLEHKFFSTHDKANFLLAELPCNIFFFWSDNKKIALHPYWPEQYSALMSWYLIQQFAVTEAQKDVNTSNPRTHAYFLR